MNRDIDIVIRKVEKNPNLKDFPYITKDGLQQKMVIGLVDFGSVCFGTHIKLPAMKNIMMQLTNGLRGLKAERTIEPLI